MSGFLVVEGVSAGYGLAPVLRDVSLRIDKGEVVAVFLQVSDQSWRG